MSNNIRSLLVMLAAVLLALPAHSARRDGMNGNLLIEDHDDVFVFPHKAHSDLNRNRMRLDIDDSTRSTFFSGTGKGAWGFSVGNLLEGPRTLSASNAALAHLTANHPEVITTHVPNQVFDAFYSKGEGGKGFGVRLVLASVGSSPALGNDSRALVSGLHFGYGGASGSITYDAGLSAIIVHAGTDKDFQLTGHQVTLTTRAYKKTNQKKLDMGILLDVSNGMGSYQAQGSEAEDFSGTRIGLGAGPVYRLGDSTVATYATLSWEASEDNSGTSRSVITVPGVNTAFETPLNDWVDFRAGITHDFRSNTVTPEEGDESSTQGSDTSSSVGLSAHWDKLNFDMNLNPAFFRNGPYLLTGTSTANFALSTSITYAW